MGTELKSSDSAYAPTAISYPIDSVESPKLHTLLMVDLDHESTKGRKNHLNLRFIYCLTLIASHIHIAP